MTASFSTSNFTSLYGVSAGNDQNGDAIRFVSQDADYRVYIPGKDAAKSTAGYDGSGHLIVTLEQDHIIGTQLAKDDHSTTQMSFDQNTGNVVQVTQDIVIDDGGAAQIPKWVSTTLVVGVELIGVAAAGETDGASIEDATKVAEDISSFCEHFNAITEAIVKFTDDGGRLNFPAVIVHDMNKACSSIVY